MANILVVDDDADFVAMTRKVLEGSGHAVEVCDNGRTAITCTEKTPYDLVVLDLYLPELHGLEVYARLQINPKTRATPVLVVTGSEDQEDELKKHGLPYFMKPFDVDDFKAEVARLLG